MANIQILNASAVTKLNATNYEIWQCDMQYLLMERLCWQIVSGEEKEPDKPAKPDPMIDQEIRDFKRRRDVAMALIYQSIEPGYKKLIKGLKDPILAWKQLQKHYRPDTRSRQMDIFLQITECSMQAEEDISLYAAKLMRLYEVLYSIDDKFSEDYVSFQLLRSMPKRYDAIVQTVLRWKPEQFKFTEILNELVAEETRQRVQRRDSIVAQAVSRDLSKFKSPSTKRKITCYRCGLVGHFKRDCRVNLQKKGHSSRKDSSQNDKRRSRSPSPNMSRHNSPTKYSNDKCSNHAYFLSAQLSVTKSMEADWIVDSAASHHFSFQKELFSNFVKLSDKTMKCAVRKTVLPVVGRGDIHLIFGKKRITLKNVLYSPDLRCNLLSIPKFDEGGGGTM